MATGEPYTGNPIDVILSGQALPWGEGFDHLTLDTLFRSMPLSWKGTLAQNVGRLHRQYGGKTEVVVVDFVDEAVLMLARMEAKRRTARCRREPGPARHRFFSATISSS